MNKEQLIEIINKDLITNLNYCKEELEGCGLDWSDNYLNPKDYTPNFDFGMEDNTINFNLYLGKVIGLLDLKSKL